MLNNAINDLNKNKKKYLKKLKKARINEEGFLFFLDLCQKYLDACIEYPDSYLSIEQ